MTPEAQKRIDSAMDPYAPVVMPAGGMGAPGACYAVGMAYVLELLAKVDNRNDVTKKMSEAVEEQNQSQAALLKGIQGQFRSIGNMAQILANLSKTAKMMGLSSEFVSQLKDSSKQLTDLMNNPEIDNDDVKMYAMTLQGNEPGKQSEYQAEYEAYVSQTHIAMKKAQDAGASQGQGVNLAIERAEAQNQKLEQFGKNFGEMISSQSEYVGAES